MISPSKNVIYEFGGFRLDPQIRRLTRLQTSEPIQIAPKVFELLLILVESVGRIVSKDEIIGKLWADSIVEEGNLTQSVFLLRKALGETSREPRYILTVPQQGYRFIAEVKVIGTPAEAGNSVPMAIDEPTEKSSSDDIKELSQVEPENSIVLPAGARKFQSVSRRRMRYILAAVLVIVPGGLIFTGFYLQKQSLKANSPTEIKMLAVLPFVWRDAPADKAFLAEGLTENLIYNLSRTPNARVISYQAVSRYKDGEFDFDRVAQELKADTVITGRIVGQTNDQIQIKIEMNSVRDKTQLWGRIYTVKLEEFLQAQFRIAQDVAEQLKDKNPLHSQTETPNFEAYNFYLAGRHFLNKRTAQNLRKAIENFKTALERDPNFSGAHSGIAIAYAVSPTYGVMPPIAACPQAKEAAKRALALNENADEAYTALAFVNYRCDYDWTAADKNFRRAVELNPNSYTSRTWYGEYLSATGNFDAALAQHSVALQINPLSHRVQAELAYTHYLARRYKETIDYHLRALEIEKDFALAHYTLSEIYESQGNYEAAVLHWQKAMFSDGMKASRVAVLEQAFVKNGYKGFAQAKLDWLEELKKTSGYILPTDLAKCHIALNNKTTAVELLEKAFEERTPDLVFIKYCPTFDSLRDEPRFAALIEKMRFPTS